MTFGRKIRSVFQLVWITAGAGLILWIVFTNIPLDGKLYVNAIPGEPSPFIGAIRPVNRTEFIRGKGLPYTVIKSEPVYFNLAVPSFFRKAKIKIEYQNDGQPVFELGARSSLEEWQYDLKPLDDVGREGAAWKIGETEFDFGPLAVDANNELQMVMSFPKMKNIDAQVRIRRIWVTYEREPLTYRSFLDAIDRKMSKLMSR